jgi:large subunit ribosomal protein L1
MPNPKSGTVTDDIKDAVTSVKAGKIDFKVDKYGIINTTIGRVSFSEEKIAENAIELLHTINRLKPSAAKGTYFKSLHISSTMSPGIKIDSKTVPGL